MKKVNVTQEGSFNSRSLKKLGEKIVTNFQDANLAMKDFNVGSLVNTRLGVIIDWSNGKFIVQPTS